MPASRCTACEKRLGSILPDNPLSFSCSEFPVLTCTSWDLRHSSILIPIGEVPTSQNQEEDLQLPGPERVETHRMIRQRRAKGKFTQDSLFVSGSDKQGSEDDGRNLPPERPNRVEVGEISLERAKGTFFQVAEIDEVQALKQPQENPPGMTLRKDFGEEGDVTVHDSLSRRPEKTTPEGGKGFGRTFDLSLSHKSPMYECSYCGKRWPCQSQLRRHVKIHTGERPHKCTDCGKSFSTSSNLSQHKRVHTGERPYSCKDCGKSYRRRASLVQHERETCRKGSHLNAPAVGYVVLGNCTLLCMKKSTQGARNRAIAPKGGEMPLAAQPLNILTAYTQERIHPSD